MDFVYAQVKRTFPFFVRVLAVGLAALATVSLSSPLPLRPMEWLLTCATLTLVFSVFFFPLPVHPGPRAPALVLAWAALMSTVIVVLGGSQGMLSAPGGNGWLLAMGAGLLAAVFASLALFLAAWLDDRRGAARATLAVLLVSLAAPLWASPLIVMFGSSKWFVDALVALCPVSYLASLADIDYLRGDWFYRNTPYGGLRYDYPDPLALLFILAAMLILWLVINRRRKSQILTLTLS